MAAENKMLPDFDIDPSTLYRTSLAANEADLAQIEAGADRILEQVGLRFEGDPDTLDMWRSVGAKVKDDRICLEGARLREIIRASAPGKVTLRGRNPARDTVIGANERPVFAPVYGPPNLLLENGSRASGSLDAYRQFVSMAHASPGLSNTGHMICVLNEVAEAARPMEMTLAHLACSDKPFMGTIASPSAAGQVIDATVAAMGRQAKEGECDLLHLINSTPPLTYKENPLKCLRTIAQKRQGIMVTSYMMMGATSPVSVAGTLIQGYAEVLAGMALTQLWSPGAPMVMGLFAIPFDMQTMVPRFGDPASGLVQLYSVQLARRLGVPVRGDGGISSSKIDDVQAGYEGGFATSISALSGADMILHSAGWLEQGRCVSVAKFEREARAISEIYCPDAAPCEPPLPLDPKLEAELRANIPR